MKKTNNIKLMVDVKNGLFDVDMKHDVSPLKVLEILTKLKLEYTILLVEGEKFEEAMALIQVKNAVERLGNLDLVSIRIDEYEVNTFNTGVQKVYEINYDKKYEALDILAMLLVSIQCVTDMIKEDFGQAEQLHNLDKEDAVEAYAELLMMLDMHTSVSDIKALAGITYKRDATETLVEEVIADLMKIMDTSTDVMDMFFDRKNMLYGDDSEEETVEEEEKAPKKVVDFSEFANKDGLDMTEEEIQAYTEELGLDKELEEVIKIDEKAIKADPLEPYREDAIHLYEDIIDILRANAMDGINEAGHSCGCGCEDHGHHHKH